jgi:putative ABC transport system permease protein
VFKNLLKYSLRSFKRQRTYVIINILGLSIGIACSLFIAFYIINEKGFDRFNTRHKRVFRVIQKNNYDGQDFMAAYCPSILGPSLQEEIPEIEEFLRMSRKGPTIVEFDGKSFTEEHLIEADSSFFDIFSIPVIKGNPAHLLNAPRKLVLSESTARKIFGDSDPIDKLIKIGSDTVGYTVAGIMADVPKNSHFEANIIMSFMTNPLSDDQQWTVNSYSTYLLLKPNSSRVKVDNKISELMIKYIGPEIQQAYGISMNEWIAHGHKYGYFLQKLTDIHLDQSIMQEFKEAGDPKYLKIIGSLAILIILIAAINFMNLSTAQASRRAKEVGIKKVSGSEPSLLVIQFLTESFILSSISLVFALLLIKVTLPFLNDIIGSDLTLNLLVSWYTIPFLIVFTILVSCLAGFYPALFLSSFNPYQVLKGDVKNNMQHGQLRRVLVVFQFTVSILLTVGTIIMYSQIKYMLNKDLGFNKEHIIVITKAENLGSRMASFKETVKGIPGVRNIVSSSEVPGRNNNSVRYKLNEGKDDIYKVLETNYIDYDYLEMYGIGLKSGRPFNKSFTSDSKSCLINESAVNDFGITDLEKTQFKSSKNQNSSNFLQPIGIVKDFHFRSLHDRIGPYLFRLTTDAFMRGYMSVKLSSGSFSGTISEIEHKWKEFTGNKPFEYYFIDDYFQQMYSQEKKNARMAVIFSILAIFIAALGLFGLTSFMVEQRTKEIGVRKAMGSSLTGIYAVISREVIILISLSALISWPLIYYIGSKWLENFYYRISPGVFSFIAGLIIVLGIAVLTISYRIMAAARVNPAQSLKYE